MNSISLQGSIPQTFGKVKPQLSKTSQLVGNGYATPIPRYCQLLNHLHRGGKKAHFCNNRGESLWFDAGKAPTIPSDWLEKDIWFSVNPLSQIPPTNRLEQKVESRFVRSQTAYITAVNCLYAEFDLGKPFDCAEDILAHIEQLDAGPNVITFSGGGYHAYWLLDATIHLDTPENYLLMSAMQKRWVQFVGADCTVHNLNRVLRLPGSRNWKTKYAPNFPEVTFVKEDYSNLYSQSQLRAILPKLDERSLKPRKSTAKILHVVGKPYDPQGVNGSVSLERWENSVEKIQWMLEQLAPWRCDDRDEWLRVGMAIHDTDDSDTGFQLWDEWSQKSDKYTGDTEGIWDGFTHSQANPVTMGTIYHMIKEDAPSAVQSEPVHLHTDPTESGGWQVFDLRQAYQQREATKFLVDGLISVPSLTIVYGAPGALKSLLLQNLGACVVAGKTWLGSRKRLGEVPEGTTFKTKKVPVLWVDLDNGKQRTHEHIEAVSRAQGLLEDAPYHYISMPDPWLDVSADTRLFEAMIKHLGAKLVFIDNLTVITGNVNLNDSQMSVVMGNLRRISEESDCAIVIIHHQRKGNGDSSARKGESLLGHTSIEASLDLALMVTREEGTQEVYVQPTKVRGYVKVRGFSATFAYKHKYDSHDLHEAWFEAATIVSPEDQRLDNILTAAIEVLKREGELSENKLTKLVKESSLADGIGEHKVRGFLKKLVETKQLSCKDGQNGKLYALVDSGD